MVVEAVFDKGSLILSAIEPAEVRVVFGEKKVWFYCI